MTLETGSLGTAERISSRTESKSEAESKFEVEDEDVESLPPPPPLAQLLSEHISRSVRLSEVSLRRLVFMSDFVRVGIVPDSTFVIAQVGLEVAKTLSPS